MHLLVIGGVWFDWCRYILKMMIKIPYFETSMVFLFLFSFSSLDIVISFLDLLSNLFFRNDMFLFFPLFSSTSCFTVHVLEGIPFTSFYSLCFLYSLSPLSLSFRSSRYYLYFLSSRYLLSYFNFNFAVFLSPMLYYLLLEFILLIMLAIVLLFNYFLF